MDLYGKGEEIDWPNKKKTRKQRKIGGVIAVDIGEGGEGTFLREILLYFSMMDGRAMGERATNFCHIITIAEYPTCMSGLWSFSTFAKYILGT